jgi:adenylylsulfate kinase
MSWVIWITGLPGSGKSTIAEAVKEKIPDTIILRMDELRRVMTPEPTYSDTEREYVYRALVFSAKTLYEAGHNVIIDATGNRRSWRRLARGLIPNFLEVYLRCPIEVCIRREKKRPITHAAPRGVYEKGRKGWPVPGIGVPYEEPEKPEITINTDKDPPAVAVGKILKLIQEY